MKGTIGIVDDQQLFLKSVGMYVNSLPDFNVTLCATNGTDLFTQLAHQLPPDILLIDVNIPGEKGDKIAAKIKTGYPSIKMAAFSMMEDSCNVMKMIKAGCCAYLSKSINPTDLEIALKEIMIRGYYNTKMTNIWYHNRSTNQHIELKERELQFLELACSDLTYQEIAAKMFVSIKTVDGYRALLFEKFRVKSRVALILEAIRRNLISV